MMDVGYYDADEDSEERREQGQVFRWRLGRRLEELGSEIEQRRVANPSVRFLDVCRELALKHIGDLAAHEMWIEGYLDGEWRTWIHQNVSKESDATYQPDEVEEAWKVWGHAWGE